MSSSDSLTRDVVELFRELLHALLMSSVPAWLDLQLTVPQLRALFIVAHSGSCSVAHVAEHLGVGEPTASHLVSRVVEAGLVARSEDPEDRRRMRVRLTEAGEGLIEKLLGWEDMLGGWLYGLSEEDLSLVRQGLGRVVDEARTRARTTQPGYRNRGQEETPHVEFHP